MPTTTVALSLVSASAEWSGSPSVAAALAANDGNEARAFGGAGAEASLEMLLQTSLPTGATNIRAYLRLTCRLTSQFAVVSMTLSGNGVSRSKLNAAETTAQFVNFGAVGANDFGFTSTSLAAGVAVSFAASDIADFGLDLYANVLEALIDYDESSASPASPSRLALGSSLGL